MKEYLDTLNDEQLRAVTAGSGPVLVLAGAGSGKTRVLTSRIAYLIDEMGVSANEIMALTFTNKAAREMSERLSNILEQDVYRLWVGTFHRICLRILRMEGERIGVDPNFVIYDDADQRSLIKTILKQKGIDPGELTPAMVLKIIGDAKNQMLSPEAFEEMAVTAREEEVVEVYYAYEKQKKANNALDFDDLLLYVVELFTTCHDVLAHYRQHFPYVLVDEYQDTNDAQYRFLRLLAGKEGNLFVVGDPDQSIYAFRGAKIENILNFQRDYPEAKVYPLECNYRSTSAILQVANDLICHNKGRLEKTLYAARDGGKPVEALLLADEKAEAIYIADNARDMESRGLYRYRDMAVFYRTHAQSRVLEDVLMRKKIPYKVFGGQRFYDRKEIKDTLAYLRLIMNSGDNVSLLRVINEPRRGIGGVTLEKLEDSSVEQGISIWDTIKDNIDPELYKSAARKALQGFVDIIKELKLMARSANVTDLVVALWDKTGYKNMLEAENTMESQSRLENMAEFLTVTHDFDVAHKDAPEEGGLENFLAGISLSSDLDKMDNEDYLTLMTIHMAKGLEFPVVFLMGMEESIFPHVRSVLSGSESEIEEERRLCYVGLTRAMDDLRILRAYRRTLWGRTMYNKPSRFLSEMNLPVPEAPVKKEIHPSPLNAFNVGDKVRHGKFGDGIIVAMDGEGKVNIAFPDLGIKEFLLEYANLEILDQ
ncbi:MAG: UvrD-helicase domain-containing protein [Bacillota bacterium]|nr:UvrD-helicase domain-containing protein [Bacillota bacterium]